jgi:hypothetical protein
MAENGNGNGNGYASSNRGMQWIVTLFPLLIVVVGSMVTFFITMSTLGAQVSALGARVTSLEQNYNQMSEREMILRTNSATMGAKMSEIETQFCGEDHVRNLMHSQDLRTMSMMWNKVFPNSTLPSSDAYYPQICNRGSYDSTGGHP